MAETQNIKVVAIPVPVLGQVWDQVALLLYAGLAEARNMSLRDVLDGLFDGTYQLWAIYDEGRICAAFITGVMRDGDLRFLDVSALSGDGIKKWGKPLSSAMNLHAGELGCEKVRFVGRRGLERVYDGVRIVGDEFSPGNYRFERDVT